MASLDNGNSDEGKREKPTSRATAHQAHKKASLELLQVRLIGKKLAATYSPAGVQYHRRDRA